MLRKLLLVLIVSVVSLTTVAQHLGIQGGALATNVSWRTDMYSLNTLPTPGFMAGLSLDIPVKNGMVINTALNYKWAGAALLDSLDAEAIRLGYVNLDITVGYVFETVTIVKPYVEGGTYGAYLVNSKKIIKPENEEVRYEDVRIGNKSTDEIIPWDFGWTIGGGIYLGKWKFGLGYQASFINLSPDPEILLRNKVGYLRVTYFFGRKGLRSN